MDLKDFIKNTISSIARSTSELQDELGHDGIVINPPRTTKSENFFDPDSEHATKRFIVDVQFDVAVTASQETMGKGGGKLEVLSVVSLGIEGGNTRAQQEVSHVQFSIPIVLRPTILEEEARRKAKEMRGENESKTT